MFWSNGSHVGLHRHIFNSPHWCIISDRTAMLSCFKFTLQPLFFYSCPNTKRGNVCKKFHLIRGLLQFRTTLWPEILGLQEHIYKKPLFCPKCLVYSIKTLPLPLMEIAIPWDQSVEKRGFQALWTISQFSHSQWVPLVCTVLVVRSTHAQKGSYWQLIRVISNSNKIQLLGLCQSKSFKS